MYEQPHYATINHYTVKTVHLNKLFKLYLYAKLYSLQILYSTSIQIVVKNTSKKHKLIIE